MKRIFLTLTFICLIVFSVQTLCSSQTSDQLSAADSIHSNENGQPPPLADSLSSDMMSDSSSALASDTARFHKLTITSNLDQAKIYSDTMLIGTTPLSDYNIKEGDHKIKIVNPKSLQDWQNDNRTLELKISKDTSINVMFKYFYYLNTIPYNADVYMNDTLLGKTPLRFFEDTELKGSLLIKMKNYKNYSYDLRNYDFTTGANITLKSKGLETVNDLVYKDRSTQFKTKRNIFPILGTAAASVFTAVMAFNYKNIANSEYDKYLLRGNPQNLQESQNNDVYFAVSVAVMQVAIGGLVYFLFFDK